MADQGPPSCGARKEATGDNEVRTPQNAQKPPDDVLELLQSCSFACKGRRGRTPTPAPTYAFRGARHAKARLCDSLARLARFGGGVEHVEEASLVDLRQLAELRLPPVQFLHHLPGGRSCGNVSGHRYFTGLQMRMPSTVPCAESWRRALHEVASRIIVSAVARWLARRKVANARKYAMGRGWRVRVR